MTKKRQHPHAHLLRLAAASLPIVSDNPMPSASDPSVAHPDLVKFEYAEFVSHQEPGKTKLAPMETAIVQGPLGFAGDISRHWAMVFVYRVSLRWRHRRRQRSAAFGGGDQIKHERFGAM
jgi:hypothetical protein